MGSAPPPWGLGVAGVVARAPPGRCGTATRATPPCRCGSVSPSTPPGARGTFGFRASDERAEPDALGKAEPSKMLTPDTSGASTLLLGDQSPQLRLLVAQGAEDRPVGLLGVVALLLGVTNSGLDPRGRVLSRRRGTKHRFPLCGETSSNWEDYIRTRRKAEGRPAKDGP